MNNHIQMLIEQEEVPLSKIMQGTQQNFTQRYNRKYRRTGHVFQQRYKAQICNKDEYLVQLIKYIHMNPEKAKMEEGLDYRWSSHREYIEKGKSQLIKWDEIFQDPVMAAAMIYRLTHKSYLVNMKETQKWIQSQ